MSSPAAGSGRRKWGWDDPDTRFVSAHPPERNTATRPSLGSGRQTGMNEGRHEKRLVAPCVSLPALAVANDSTAFTEASPNPLRQLPAQLLWRLPNDVMILSCVKRQSADTVLATAVDHG